MTQPLHLMLQRSGVLTSQQLELTLRQAKARNVGLLDLLVLERRVPEESLAEAFSRWLNVPRLPLESVRVEPNVLHVVPERLVRRYTCLPIRFSGKHGKDLVLAMANPLDTEAIRDVQFASNRTVEPVVACKTELLNAIERHYRAPEPRRTVPAPSRTVEFVSASDTRDELNLDDSASADEQPAIGMCDFILRDAIAERASDIHIEPEADGARVRIRVDGVLRQHVELPRWLLLPLVSRIKVLGKLDIAQQRLPQDGRISAIYRGRRTNIRVSTLPTHFGEKVVLRLLGSSSVPPLNGLGLADDEVSLFRETINQPQGLVLVTGPTGAGKSTTLYSMLAERASSDVNIVTIEDPIEYQVDGLSQVQVDAKAGLTFAKSLRAILRQDPDVILVGEIRDLETAEVAFQAALTGHLVLTTLHTNSSVAAIARLLDLGLKPSLITSAVSLVIAQRLARRVCDQCRTLYVPEPAALQKLRIEPGTQLSHGAGCAACSGTGYSGRIGIFEMLTPNEAVRGLVRRQAGERELAAAARLAGTAFLLDDAVLKVRAGLTTVEEIGRVMQIVREADPVPPARPGLVIRRRARRASAI